MTLRLTRDQFKAHQARVTVESAPTKYRNRPTGGYASAKEAKRAQELQMLAKQGLIKDLAEQVRFVVIPKQKTERECVYVADFTYQERREDLGFVHWMPVVEDVKSPASRTPEYVIKRKLMLYVHGIRIRET